MDSLDLIIDASNPHEKREAIRVVGEAQRKVASLSRGKHRIEIKISRYSKRRTDQQNRYYWPCFVKPLVDYLRAQGDTTDDGDEVTDDHVHGMYRMKFLRTAIVDKSSGEILGSRIRSTTELTTVEFNEYLDKIAHWLATYVGIVVPDPSVYHEREESAERGEAA